MSIHPMQPVENDDGAIRFVQNEIVSYLLDSGGIDMNKLAALEFSREDREQFAQLIGYSVRGFHELPYVSDNAAKRATELARKIDPAFEACRDGGCEIHSGVEGD